MIPMGRPELTKEVETAVSFGRIITRSSLPQWNEFSCCLWENSSGIDRIIMLRYEMTIANGTSYGVVHIHLVYAVLE